MQQATCTRLLLGVALFSSFATTAAGRDSYDQSDLALLQTAVQVDDAHLNIVPDRPIFQVARPIPKVINDAARTVVIVTVVCLVILLGYIYRGWPFSQKGKEIIKDYIKDKDKTSAISGMLASEPAAIEAGEEAPTEEVVPNHMTWATYLMGIGSSVMCIFCTAFFSPNLPQMAADFGTTDQSMIATIQINWIVSALAALIMGPLSDRIGRKPVVCFGLLALGTSTLTCAGSGDIYWFWASRAIQGLGEGGQVAVRGTYRDAYDMKQRVRVGIVATVCCSFIPVCAPSVGGLLAEATGSWRWAFFMVSIVCFVLSMLGFLFMDETLTPDCRPVKYSFNKEMKTILCNRHLNVLMAFQVLMSCMSRSGAGNDAFIIEMDYHKSPKFYSLICGSFVLVGIFTSVCYLALQKFRPVRVLQVFMALMPFVGIYEFLTGYFLTNSFGPYITSKYVLTVAMTPPVLVAGPLYMEQVKRSSAGTANAISIAVNNFVGTGIGWIGSHMVSKSPQEPAMMCYVNGFFLILSIIIFWVGFGLNPPEWAYGKDKTDPPMSAQQKA
mmetsp:Transcript_62914/g.135091  ORF Transcript_62914/g.135091 Transcript_62914/m.135091 type:complete len:554 (-) Transcript_62914:145-1806(-)